MQKAIHIARMSQKCVTRGQTAKIPLCASDCRIPNSTINRNISRWLSRQQRLLFLKQRKKKRKSDISSFTVKRNTGSFDPFHNLPPEALAFLNKFKRKRSIGEAGFDGKSTYAPIQVDQTNPSLAKYLRSVMENGDLNQIYNINYYFDPMKAIFDSVRLEDFLDPYEVARILAVLGRGGNLTQEQWDYLMNFFKAAAQLDPEVLWKYFKMLQDAGLLTSQVMLLLHNLLRQMSLQLTSSKLNLLLNTLTRVENYQKLTAWKELQRLRKLEEAEKIEQELEQQRLRTERRKLKIEVKKENEKRYYRTRYSERDEIFNIPFFKPWDADIKWEDARSLMRRSKRRRTAHRDLYDCYNQIAGKSLTAKLEEIKKCKQMIADQRSNHEIRRKHKHSKHSRSRHSSRRR